MKRKEKNKKEERKEGEKRRVRRGKEENGRCACFYTKMKRNLSKT
jgi:hypothetical protein